MRPGGDRWWGPVFAAERVTRARRWQEYAVRSGFVAVLLLGLVLVWSEQAARADQGTIGALAQLGSSLYSILVVIVLTAVLLIAPAATAGAVCLDKSRGTLAHMFVTDLTNREIILGKLAARLGPVWSLLACALPVAAVVTWLGGVDPVALTGLFVVAAGLAALGCSVALMLSVWAKRAYEVLAIVFGVWAAWLLAWPYQDFILRRGKPGPEWIELTNPFYLAYAPYTRPGETSLVEPILFGLACGLLGAGCLAVAVAKVRGVACRSDRVRNGRRRQWGGEVGARIGAGMRSVGAPRLDANPVLWREWHRTRPSGWLRLVGLAYGVSASTVCGSLVASKLTGPYNGFNTQMTGLAVGLLTMLGLLLISVTAAAVLTEERTRGSLDVLLCTPISTRAILGAKWRAAFRPIPWLAAWPVVIALTYPTIDDLGWLQWTLYGLVPILILIQGAAVVSLGLALATWIKRTGQATTWTVTAVAVAVIGWMVVGLWVPLNDPTGAHPRSPYANRLCELVFLMGSPFGNTFIPLVMAAKDMGGTQMPAERLAGLTLLIGWGSGYALLAWLLFEGTVATFDRALGRIPERRQPRC